MHRPILLMMLAVLAHSRVHVDRQDSTHHAYRWFQSYASTFDVHLPYSSLARALSGADTPRLSPLSPRSLLTSLHAPARGRERVRVGGRAAAACRARALWAARLRPPVPVPRASAPRARRAHAPPWTRRAARRRARARAATPAHRDRGRAGPRAAPATAAPTPRASPAASAARAL